ncbi:YDG domain-containing protein, partial [Arthrospira platensis SPKY1]|nr:YDG domain-containing protein [Arthrospira platensis SPKY1]
GSLLTITATPATGWTFVGWTGAVLGSLDATPNTIQVNGAIVPLTATFKRMLTLTAFDADDKTYDGNTSATVTTWGTLVGIQPGDNVTLVTGAYSATFDDALVG